MSYDNSHAAGLVLAVTTKAKAAAAVQSVKDNADKLLVALKGNSQNVRDNTCGFVKGLITGFRL